MCTDQLFAGAARRRQAGVTMIELIIAIMVVGVAMAGMISVIVATSRGSADPMVRAQAQLIAESYLEEILLKRFYDPDEDLVCPAAEGLRKDYDNVCDYDPTGAGVTDNPPKDQLGTVIGALTGYAVTVQVTRDNTVTLNGLNNDTATNLYRVLRVDVTVNGPGAAKAAVTGYRTNYNCNVVATDPECKP
ncbi:MAG: prepilin-type N-terminal cleavage/methylation domain-containing protein [Pseudomonadota bacterium]